MRVGQVPKWRVLYKHTPEDKFSKTNCAVSQRVIPASTISGVMKRLLNSHYNWQTSKIVSVNIKLEEC